MELDWQEPPATKIRTHGYWIDVKEALKENKGKWAFFKMPPTGVIQVHFKKMDGYERRWITNEDNTKDLFMRYVDIEDLKEK